MMLHSTFKEEFIAAITDNPLDKFAKTFVAKANMQDIWRYCVGAWCDNKLMGAIITTVSKRSPHIANLQLLHVFAEHRNKGIGKLLTQNSLHTAIFVGAEYFRVSAEPDAVEFYKKVGFKFLGVQKSNCELSMFRIVDDTFEHGIYDCNDPIIYKAIHKNGKGGCIKIHDNCK